MGSLIKLVAGLLAWGAALYGVLQLGLMDHTVGHGHGRFGSICGPWGCGPPTESLLAIHGFWLLLLAPPATMLIRSCSARRLTFIGLGTALFCLIALAGVAAWEAFHYLPLIQPGRPSYFMRRILFSVATLVDVPIVASTIFAAVFFIAAQAKGKRTCKPCPGSCSENINTAETPAEAEKANPLLPKSAIAPQD